MPRGTFKNGGERSKKISLALKGKKRHPLSEEHKKKISLANSVSHIGIRPTLETKIKMSKIRRGKKIHTEQTKHRFSIERKGAGNPFFGKKHTEETKKIMKLSREMVHSRILKEMAEFEQQGFRCMPTGGRVVPDFVAIKDNKVFAVEVEYGKPNYSKYTDDIKKYFDDIIWILRTKNY